MPRFSLPLLLAYVALTVAVSALNIQSPNVKANPRRANAVKQAFIKSYNGYKQHCFGHDELAPLSKTCQDPLGGWGATVVDVQSTAHVMGLMDIYSETVLQSLKTDYTRTDSKEISIFETTIRHLGGLLSSYELGGKKEPKLIDQARIVGDKLMYGWVGANDIPYNTLTYWNGLPTPKTDDGAIIAETGTLIIEFDRLSKYTGNTTYRDYATRSELATINSSPLPFPNLNPQGIEPTTGKPRGDYVTWGGGSDSFFEYLNKYALLTGKKESYFPAWISAVRSSILNLITVAGGTKKKLTYLADYSASRNGSIPRGSHLECFVGGNWLLGGKLLGNDDIFQYGLDLAESCINTYTSSATGIGPEGFIYKLANGSSNGVNITHAAFYEKNGFDYSSKPYVLRPEVMESVFYAYRLTGDTHWQDLAWQAFQAIRKYCDTDTAFTALRDVSNATTAQIDDSESFLYAELFKYSYLTFTDGNVMDLGKYVFNTEAHPFEIDDPSVDFTSLNPGSIRAPAAHVSPTSSSSAAVEENKGNGGEEAATRASDMSSSAAASKTKTPTGWSKASPLLNGLVKRSKEVKQYVVSRPLEVAPAGQARFSRQ